MKGKKNKILLVFCFVVGLTCFSQLSFSEPVSSNNTFARITNGKIGFSENIDPDIPVDPNDGDKVKAKKKPTEGPLSISYVSDFSFGSHVIETKSKEYFAENDLLTIDSTNKQIETPNFIQISDATGTKDGWELRAKMSDHLTNENGTKISNAIFKFYNITPKPVKSDNNNDQISEKVLVPSDVIELTGNMEQSTLVAKSEGLEAQGRWHILFGGDKEQGKKSVSLFIPRNGVKEEGNYQTSIVWEFIKSK